MLPKTLNNYWIILVLGSLMIGVAFLSVFVLSQQSLRLDEAQSLWQTSFSLERMLYIVGEDVHPPFYHLLLHLWQSFFGNDVVTVRTLSLMFFLLTIPAVYWAGSIVYSRSIALMAAALVAVSPFLNWYGSEARMYSLMGLLGTLNQAFFLLIRKSGKRTAWSGYAISAVLGMYTHYFFGFILLAQGIFFLADRKSFAKHDLRRFMLTALIVAISLAPWTYFVWSLGGFARTQPFILPPTSIDLFNTLSNLLFGFQTNYLNTLIISLWPVLVLFAFLVLSEERKFEKEALYFFFAALLPITAAFIISISLRPLFLSRYLIFSAPPLYLFLAWMISSYRQRIASAVLKVAFILGMSLTLTQEIQSKEISVKEDFRTASQYLAQNATPRDIIVISAPFTIYPVEYYYQGSTAITTLPKWDRYAYGPIPSFTDEGMRQDVASFRSDHQRAFVLLSHDQGYQTDLQQYLNSSFLLIEEKEFSPGLTISVYQLKNHSVFQSSITE